MTICCRYEWHVQAEGVADGVEAVQHKTREIIKYGADLMVRSALHAACCRRRWSAGVAVTLDEMKAIVADAHRLGRKVAAHAHGAEGIAGRRRRESIRSSTVRTLTMRPSPL